MSKRKILALKLASGAVVIILIAISCMLLISGCSSSGTPYDQEDGVIEPDKIVVTTDGYIIKLQPDGMTAVKTDNGGLTVAKSKKAPAEQTPVDLIAYGNYIISIVTFQRYNTLVSVYDAAELNDGTNRIEPVRKTVFLGEYYTCRIYDGTLYFIAKSANTYLKYNEETREYEETGAVDTVVDSVEGEKEFTNINSEKEDRVFGGYLLASLSLDAPKTAHYTLSSYRARDISSLYFSQHGIYLVFSSEGNGCGSSPQFSLCRVDPKTLTVAAKSNTYDGNVENRYCLYDNGEYLFAAVNYGTVILYTFDREMKDAFVLNDIADSGYLEACYFTGGFCYIETSSYALKIDITDPLSPLTVETEKISKSGEYLVEFGSGYMIGAGINNKTLTVNYYETEGDELYLINTAEAELTGTYSIELRGITASAENGRISVCADSGLIIFGLDLYGYIEYKSTVDITGYDIEEIAAMTQKQQRIYRSVIIGEYLYAVADGAVLSFKCDNMEYVSYVSTIL